MNELELKFQVPAQALKSLQAELARHGARTERMVARYFDTADGALAQSGLSLRLRREGRRWVQTLKAEGASVVHRLEHNVPLRVAAGSRPELDLARHDGDEAGAALRRALADADAGSVVERYGSDVSRRFCDLQTPTGVVEAALDLGAIKAGDHEAAVCELELEHKAGDTDALFAVAEAWSRHGSLWLNTLSKSARGARLAEGREHGPAKKADTPKLEGQMSGDELLRAVMRSALDQILVNASEVAAGSVDADHVHQLRVGMRRLRTALRELGCLAGGADPAWEDGLSRTFALLGQVRDNETVAQAVRPLLEQVDAPKLQWDAPASKVEAGATVRDAAFQATLIDLLGFAMRAQGDGEPKTSHAQAMEYISERLSKLHKRIARAGKRFKKLPPEDQHKVRKRLKRLRYLSEFVEPLWNEKAVGRYLKHLRPAQDALGHHNDVAVAMNKFREDAARDPAALFAAGYLQAHLQTTARSAHAALQEVGKARRFWKR